MSQPQNNQSEMLSGWLKVATDGLCAHAKSRITLEIEAHFNETVAAHLEEGQSLDGAEELALTELGDARKVGRRFRKKYITEKQAQRLKKLVTGACKTPIFDSISSAIIFGFLFAIGVLDCRWFAISFVILSICPWVRYFSVRRVPLKLAIQRIILLQTLEQVFLFGALSIWICGCWHVAVELKIAVCILLWVLNTLLMVRTLHTWQKLRDEPLSES
jgi:hypothetical protein